MTRSVDQRDISSAPTRVGRKPAPAFGEEGGSDEPTDPGLGEAGRAPSPWRLNTLGALLAAALICSLLLALGLWIKLSRARADLAEAEAAAEMAEAAVAREPAAPEDEARGAAVPPPVRALPEPALDLTRRAPAGPAVAPAASERLVLLLTVGTRHFAEKQLRRLRRQCRAPLAVYRQMRGRCAFSQCFAVAIPETAAGLARGCGQVKGQALRDKADFDSP